MSNHGVVGFSFKAACTDEDETVGTATYTIPGKEPLTVFMPSFATANSVYYMMIQAHQFGLRQGVDMAKTRMNRAVDGILA